MDLHSLTLLNAALSHGFPAVGLIVALGARCRI